MPHNELYLHIAFGTVLTLVGYCVTWMMKKFIRVMDHPNERSSHELTIPRAGGLSVVITFLIGMATLWLVKTSAVASHDFLIPFIGCCVMIAVVSLLDDIFEATAKFKLLTQVIAVLIVLYAGITLDQLALPVVGYFDLSWGGYVLSFVWLLGLTNAYNFMDGLDGLAGGTAVITCLFFMAITYYAGSSFVYITCYTILAGALGFLLLNYPPARIFMGDVGSTFLGFVFAALAIIAARYDESHTSFLVIPMLLFHFIYDTTFTFIRRLIRRERVLKAHRTHLYQLYQRLGHTHLEVVLTLYCMCFLQGLGAIWMMQIPGDERAFVFIPYLVLQLLYTRYVIRRAKLAKLIQ